MELPQLAVIIASTRPNRVGAAVGHWFVEVAKAHGGFDVRAVDLKEVALPLFDEPKHPRFAEYEHAHTKAWSALIQPADAFVFVTPEYNYAPPPSLINAIDFLHREWAYKVAGFVSYGGVVGGARAVAVAKQLLTPLKVMPLGEAVTIPFVNNHIENGAFRGNDALAGSAKVMLDELRRWAPALRTMRV